MDLLVLALAASIQREEVAVPPRPKFEIGMSIARHVTLTAVMCDSGDKSSMDAVLTSTPKAIEKGGRHLTLLSLEVKGQGRSTYALRTDENGRPLECKIVGKVDEDEGLNGLILFMRQPLWPTTIRAGAWTISVPNPLKPTEFLKVSCNVKRGIGETLRLEEKTGVIALAAGMSLQFTSVFSIDSGTGRVLTLNEEIDMIADGKKSQVIGFDERD